MDENLTIIEKKLNDLEESIGILSEALEEKESVSLTNNDTFKSIISIIKELKKYDKDDSKELFIGYYKTIIIQLEKAFYNKDFVNQDDKKNISICLKNINFLMTEMDKYINQPFYIFFEGLKRIAREFENLYWNYIGFLYDGQIDNQFLIEYENIINKLLNIIENSDIIKKDMYDDDFEKFKLELNNNYKKFRTSLNNIYSGIMRSNSEEVARPLLGQPTKALKEENYSAIRNNSVIHKEITDKDYRKSIIENLVNLIKSLESIIERYKSYRINKGNNSKVDSLDNTDSDEIDIPHFIEDNYEKYRNSSSEEKDVTYDKKVTAFITRFAILKRKLERKKSLTKEEVKLYNKLESELEALKSGKSNGFISGIKFNRYYKLLNKMLRLSKEHKYTEITSGNKKRK